MKNFLIIILLAVAFKATAQHQHTPADTAKHTMPMGDMKVMKGMQHDHSQMDHADTSKHMMMMSSQLSRDLPMNRDGSGSSWVPDATPMYGYMIHGKKWMSMVHGSIFARYTNQGGKRGGSEFDAPNWFMGMTQRRVGSNGLFAANVMLSLDPFLVGNNGYPLLYQTGEMYKGHKLVDRQHPHDLFSELNVSYAQRIAPNTDVYASIGYPGEPALGPPVFMHRLSAMNNPSAPIQHHYADATHITFGVATLGFRYKNVKLEGSTFKGREPDEFRYGFDKLQLDSYSMRLSYNPTKNWALQVSHGWLKGPEAHEPDQDINLFTASAMYAKMLNINSYFTGTVVYGQNHYVGTSETLPSVLFEGTLQLNKTAVYGSYTFVRKDAEELDLESSFPANPAFSINAATLGLNRILATIKKTELRAGAQATLNVSPTALKSFYGSTPVGFEVYLRVNPGLMR